MKQENSLKDLRALVSRAGLLKKEEPAKARKVLNKEGKGGKPATNPPKKNQRAPHQEQQKGHSPDSPIPITLAPGLPVSERAEELISAIRENPVIIVCGETGSGKTTQLPKICLLAGRGQKGIIGHTQPRRIATSSVAKRIAEELKTPLGEVVGYKVRFTDHTSPTAKIKLMTDGILLAETQSDPLLKHYDTIIIDEAHERSINIDFLLGYLKRLLEKRHDLRVIVTSATIILSALRITLLEVAKTPLSLRFQGAPILWKSATAPLKMRMKKMTRP